MSGYLKNRIKNIMFKKMLKKYIFIIIFTLVIISGAVSVSSVMFRFNESKQMEETLAGDAINRRLEGVFAAMNDFPGSAGKDLLFLHNLSSVQSLHKTDSRTISAALESDFKNFLKNNNQYKDLVFYRKNFNCVMRVSSNDEHSNDLCEEPPSIIANFLKESDPLSLGEVYISPLISYADISTRDEDRNIPVIVYITPANTDCSIVSIIDANYFLEEVRRLAREDESVFLLDGDGVYLANADRSQEKFSDGIGNFYKDFPDIQNNALLDTKLRSFETATKRFSFRRIYPTESNFAIYEGTNKVFGKERKDEYFWIMAVVSDKITKSFWQSNLLYILIITTIIIAHFSVAGSVIVVKRFYET